LVWALLPLPLFCSVITSPSVLMGLTESFTLR